MRLKREMRVLADIFRAIARAVLSIWERLRTKTERKEKPEDAPQRYPWEDSYPESIDWRARIPQKRLFDIFDNSALGFPNNPCIDFLGRTYTYQEISELIDNAAKGFQNIGVKKGTRVGLFLPNTPYYVISFFAVLKIGGVVVNYNPQYAADQIKYMVNNSGTEILVTTDYHTLYQKIIGLLDSTSLKYIVVCKMSGILPTLKRFLYSIFKRMKIAAIPSDDRYVRFEALIENSGDFQCVEIEPSDIAVLQYTGGITGVIKAAALSHGNLYVNAVQTSMLFTEATYGEEKIVGVIPLCHVFAMTAAMNTGFYLGAELILIPEFNVDVILKTIAKKKATVFFGVPAMYAMINRFQKLDRYDLSSLKGCISGGAPLPKEVKELFERRVCPLYEGYGLTECSGVATYNPIPSRDNTGSVGLPLPGTVIEIVSLGDPSRALSLGEEGEVCISGPQVMRHYFKSHKETENVFVCGRLRTGDIGYLDENGRLHITGHSKQLILVSGFNVYPGRVAKEIMCHTAVRDVVVEGIPDTLRGNIVKATIVLSEEGKLNDSELRDFLKDRLASYEIPRRIEFVNSI